MSLTRLDARSLQVRLAEGRADLYDIREPAEYAREHIDGARLLPAGRLGRELPDRTPGRLAVFMCQSGMRTTENATRILGCISGEVAMLDGGLEAWKRAGLPVIEDRSAPLPLMRQVQIVAGSLVLLGVMLGFLLGPAWFGLAGFVGAGLVFAGLTGFCGMARLLAQLPWNRIDPPSAPRAV